MSDRIMSPDGKHMWTGSEWIPAPPNDNQDLKSNEESHQPGDVNQLLSNEQIKVDTVKPYQHYQWLNQYLKYNTNKS